MSSKKTKSTKESKVSKKSPRKKTYQPELVAPDCWVNELAGNDINDDRWKCSVTIIEEESTDSTVYMEHFNESTINGNRLSVKSISKMDIIHYIIINMVENNPGKSLTPLKLLCSEVFKIVGPEFKIKIPTPLLASLIKYLILEYKDLNKTIREGIEKRKKGFEEYHQSLLHIPANIKSSKGTTVMSQVENKSNKQDKNTKAKTSEKPFTKLRKRGEEWKDITWVDDSPDDGPQLYIAISTFFDPDLPLELLHLNVPLDAIAKLSLWETSSSTKSSKKSSITAELKTKMQSLQDFRRKSSPHLNSTLRKRLSNETVKTANSKAKISSFWETMHKLKTEHPTALMFKNVMFLFFTPEHFSFQYHIKSFQEEIYKQISYFLFDVHEIRTQHIQYLSEIRQTNVLSTETFDSSKMQIYKSILDRVPSEICNIPFLLDAIVIQVCGIENEASNQGILQEAEKTNKKSSSIVLNNYLTKLLEQLNLKYDLFNDQVNSVFNNEEYKRNMDICNIKHILKHLDDTNINTFHLQEDIAEFVRKRIAHILQVSWKNTLLNLFSVSHHDENIVKLCGEMIVTAKENNENLLNYYIYILTVNSILNSFLIHDLSNSTLKVNSLKPSVHYDREIVCEDCFLEINNNTFSSASYLKNTVSNLSSSASKMTSYKQSDDVVESNLFYIEYMTTDVMLQWIQTAWNNFNKLETRYCPFTNQVVIVFHNFLNPKVGLFEEKLVGKLITHVPIRDFVEYIIEEEKDWLAQINYSKFTTADFSKLDKAITPYVDKPLPDELPFTFPEYQFISHRSLKYETMLKQQKSENKLKVTSTEKNKSPNPETVSKQSKSSKKVKVKDKKKEKKISENKLGSVRVDSLKVETPKNNYKFIGYDLGDPMRIQFSGFKKEKILDDCCRIKLQTMEKLYGEKSQSLTVTMSGHSLHYMYKPYCESTLINPFHLILSSGIVLYFGLLNKENKEISTFDEMQNTLNRVGTDQASLMINNSVLETDFIAPPTVVPTLRESVRFIESNDFTPNERSNSSCFQHTLGKIPYYDIPLTYNLKMSLPNGLHIELAKDDSLFYIRQTPLSRSMLANNVENEKLRCYLSNGYIVKFLLNDTAEILSPNGLFYIVFGIKEEPFKYGKEQATDFKEETIPKPTLSDISVSKNKRVSLKEKTEESSKSSNVNSKKSDKKSDSHTSSSTFIHTKETQAQEVEQNSNLINVFDFVCTTSDGKRFRVQNNKITENLKDLLTIHKVNVAENCIDSERTDGVLTKHVVDGSLVVQFTDGSRITSTPLETGEVFCEWSPEEMKQWFHDSSETLDVDNSLKTEKSLSIPSKSSNIKSITISRKIEKTAALTSLSKSNSIQSEVISPEQQERALKVSLIEGGSLKSNLETTYSKTSTETLLTNTSNQYTSKKPFYYEDGFVVYHISYLMEHPNYVSVYYDANNCEVELKLPLNTKITLKNDGSYEANFDGASLTVDNDEIYFGKVSESGDFERTAIINNFATNNTNPVNFSNYFNRLNSNSLSLSIDEFCRSTGIKSLVKEMVKKTDIKNGLLLYCVDAKVNEMIVDYDFNIYELPITNNKYSTLGNSFTSMVINENLDGFRLVSDEEVKSHLQLITEKHGLLQETDNVWKSLLTTMPVVKNESEKWLMDYEKNLAGNTETLNKTSTYGKRESWIQPFVEKEEQGLDLVSYKAVIVRLLHRIPATENILDKLNIAVQNYCRKTSKDHNIRIFMDEAGVDLLSLDELIRDPKFLCKMIKDENTKKMKTEDQFRGNMKNGFLWSLITKSIMKSRKIRKQNKEKELKTALRRKEIPPYHLSGFGYVHSILDEIFENSTNFYKKSQSESNYEKVNYIIDELLSVVSKTKHDTAAEEFEDYSIGSETESIGIKSLVSGIFRNVWSLTQDRNIHNHISAIMEKPLKLVSPDDIELITKMFGSEDCPIFQGEDFILQDVLEARLQLSNYFENLTSMLEFYRSTSQAQYHELLLQ